MNKGIIVAAIMAFLLPVGFILCQNALNTSSEPTAENGKPKGTLIYFYSPS